MASSATKLNELKTQLDSSLGYDARFKPIIAQLKLLNEEDFAEVARAALEVPFKDKKAGLKRLNNLHKVTRTNRMKEAAYCD